MLQFATDDSSRHTVEEQVSLALNAGCRWIRVTGNPSEDAIRSLIAPCQENDAILVLDNDIDLVDRLRIHGLHLTEWTRGSLIEARENLGPHAIIGVSCSDPALLGELAGLDIDYLVAYAPAGQNQEDFYASEAPAQRYTRWQAARFRYRCSQPSSPLALKDLSCLAMWPTLQIHPRSYNWRCSRLDN